MKKSLIDFLKKCKILSNEDLEKSIEIPRNKVYGDYSLNVFPIAKKNSKNPLEISKQIIEFVNANSQDFIEKVEIINGGFLNFSIKKSYVVNYVYKKLSSKTLLKFPKKNYSIVLEYPSPNTNKTLHVGHVRNIFIGNSLKNILKKYGYDVVITNLINDRGIAICKAMLSYQLFGEEKTPKDMEMKPDKFVGYFYTLFERKNEENPDLKLEDRAQEMLKKWEDGDKKVLRLWHKIVKWVYEGFKESFNSFKYKADKTYYESEIYKQGKEIVLEAYRKIPEVKREEDGAIYIDLTKYGLDKKYLLRKDGTTMYITQDIYLALLKDKDFQADKYVYIVAKEQKYHFDVLFRILELFNLGEINKYYHFQYGFVYNKDGKKFSSRKGNTFGADDLLELAVDKAKEVLEDKNSSLDEKEKLRRAKIIGYSALAFSFLKINHLNDINFDIDKAISFDGETGPYILYTLARTNSILRKVGFNFNVEGSRRNKNSRKSAEGKGKEFFGYFGDKLDYSLFNEDELDIFKFIIQIPSKVDEAAKNFKISDVANALLKLSQMFNEYYVKNTILLSDEVIKHNRLFLVYSVNSILRELLRLLDIDYLEEM